MRFFDRVAQYTSTIGQGTVSLGTAINNSMLTLAEAGAGDGDEVTFLLEEGADFEISRGIVGGGGTTVTRATVQVSKVGGVVGVNRMELAGGARFRVVETAATLNRFESNIGYQALLPEIIKTASWTATPDEAGKMLVYNSATGGTVTLPPVAASQGEVYHYRCINTGALTINPNESETIEGLNIALLPQGCSTLVWANAGKTAWRMMMMPASLSTFVASMLSGANQSAVRTTLGVGYTLKTITRITTSQTYTPASDVRAVLVRAQGAGGSGGAGATQNANSAGAATGGGAGGYVEKLIPNPVPATVTIGAAGAAATSTGGNGVSGNNGGNTTYNDGSNNLVAGGGSGGIGGFVGSPAFQVFSGATGGTATGGDINIPGEGSENSFSIGTSISAGQAVALSTNGGNSMFGHGGNGGGIRQTSDTRLDGTPGTGYGSGGGASARVMNAAGASTSGAGRPGYVEIWEFV